MNVVICYWCNWFICPIIVETVVSPFYCAAQWAAHQWGVLRRNNEPAALSLPLGGLASHLHCSDRLLMWKLLLCARKLFITFIKFNWILWIKRKRFRKEWLYSKFALSMFFIFYFSQLCFLNRFSRKLCFCIITPYFHNLVQNYIPLFWLQLGYNYNYVKAYQIL